VRRAVSLHLQISCLTGTAVRKTVELQCFVTTWRRYCNHSHCESSPTISQTEDK